MKGKGKNRSAIKIKVEVESDSSHTVPEPSTINALKGSTLFSVIPRKDSRDIQWEELRDLQYELENILVTATKRKKQLESNIKGLETSYASKNKRSRSTDSVEKKSSEEKLPKKIKESSNNKAHSAATACQPKSKFIQTPYADCHVEVPKSQKNDGPTRFWSFIEPYCADITQDSIRAIEDWIETNSSNEKYLTVPELGLHFASKWPLENVKEELREGSKSVENNKGLFTDCDKDNSEVERIWNLAKEESLSDGDQRFPDEPNPTVTDRIIYSLVAENLMTPLDDIMTEVCNDEVVQKVKPDDPQKSNSTSTDSLEKRLRKGLDEIGVLESDDTDTEDADDEVCLELKRLQSALIPVHEYNVIQKKKLLALAKVELGKQEIKKKLQEFDAKVMEMYRTIAAARKNKTMNKKLEDQAKRTLRERRKLVEKLSNMN